MPRWLVALVLLTACGPGTAQPLPSLSPPSPPTAALAAWKDFPANANPRPIIVFDRTLEHVGAAGFTTEPDRKLDWGCNKFVLAPGVTLPRHGPWRRHLISGPGIVRPVPRCCMHEELGPETRGPF